MLGSVPDPRCTRGRRYSLAALLAIAILATAAGMRGYAGFATWARTAPEEVLAGLGVRFRRPSEKTFRSVLSCLDAADLDRRLGAYFMALAAEQAAAAGEPLAVALDGKSLRGARRAGAAAAHLVSVFAHRARLVLGQLAVAEKSNEIPCVRKLLRSLRRMGLLVTVGDAHPARDRDTDLRHPEIALPDGRQVKPGQAAGPDHRTPVGRGPGCLHRRRPRPRPPRNSHPEDPHRRPRHRIPLPDRSFRSPANAS